MKTWNPIAGCSVLSPGCTKCYAMKMAARLEAMGVDHYKGLTKKVNGNAVWTGKIAKAPNSIFDAPLRVKKPTTWFVNSMSDLFHEDVSDEIILDVLTIMAISGHHTFQLLTKRAERMREVIKLETGLVDLVRLPNGMTVAIPASVAFDKMGEPEFIAFFQSAEEFLARVYGFVSEHARDAA